ncbi:mycofactocin-coupled SDR family oxidoreductase [Mycobacterium sp. URHB0044]|jgi:SDR family mycofactocin-dependent oxidoreductase|uniref:mycofactocin-coupled SDR family oxidoreductase n=1 Tax=Mycobacterium sp. URHB0044 TaxID=1380386 RepID=UPI000685C161|nr:mycofactocin-coupled SDR family oxidoreductase [Mycobacterium sp. URHB0044]
MTQPATREAVQEAPIPDAPIAHRFTGKVAFITGAARGQGRAEAERLAAEGADIIAVDICSPLSTTQYSGATPEDLDETAALVEKLGRRIVARQVDIRDFDALSTALNDGVAELGRLDVVIANAGMTTAARVWEISAEHWRESIDVNLTGAFHTAKAAVPIMLEQGSGGAIVFTSSVAGLRGLPFLGSYVAAKHGLVGLAKTLANELAEYRIRVNTVHPHGVTTDLTVPELFPQVQELAPDLGTLFIGGLPDQTSSVHDIAAAVAWIASDEARHVTGIQLPVDLGRTNR